MNRVRTLALAVVGLLALPAQAIEQPAAGTLDIEAQIPLELGGGRWMAFGFDSLWTLNATNLIRVDAATNNTTKIELPGFIGDHTRQLDVGEGAVWAASVGSGTIYKIDPATNTVALTFSSPMLTPVGRLAAGEGSLWLMTSAKGKEQNLRRYDLETGEEVAKILMPGISAPVVVAEGSVWVGGIGNNEVYRVDPASNAVTQTIPVAGIPRYMAVGEGRVWVINADTGSVQGIDAKTGEAGPPIETGLVIDADYHSLGVQGDIDVGGGFVWLNSGSSVAKVDPAGNALVERYATVTGMRGTIRYGAGSLWISGEFIYRVRPPQ
jgi:DNA-binding beta-propeller fold protein YncE